MTENYYDPDGHEYRPRALAARAIPYPRIHLLLWTNVEETNRLSKKALCGTPVTLTDYELGDMSDWRACKKCLKLMGKMNIKAGEEEVEP